MGGFREPVGEMKDVSMSSGIQRGGREFDLTESTTTDRFPWEEYLPDLLPLCEIKVEEFQLLGYRDVTAEDILECVKSMLKGRGRLHEVVSAILSLKVGQFMNYVTINAYKGSFGDGRFDAPSAR
jgi:hypothetical protein